MSLKKWLILVALVLVCVGVGTGVVLHSQAQVTKVLIGEAVRQDLIATVSGTGQIKPKTYVNVGATAFGRITHLNVKEGDRVQKGAVLASIENVQPSATVAAQQATIASSRTDVISNEAAEKTAAANVEQAKADLEQKRLDYERAGALFKDQLISRQDFDAKKAAFDMSTATLSQRQAAENQARAQTLSTRAHVNQAIASQRANYDALDKTVSRAPFDGLVTNVPVREGETVVVGIQNAEGSTLMTLADMSVITAEVKVDETDIVNVRLGQPADVTIDALPGQVFKGHVTEVGDQALLRTTGIATSQSTTGTEEAKDFKVVVTLDEVSDKLRPGLSATAKIITARRPDALTIPIQALIERNPDQERTLAANGGKTSAKEAALPSANRASEKKTTGVYLVKADRGKRSVTFVPVQTGVTGTTEIEVLNGLQPGSNIVIGSYKTLRTLASGMQVKPEAASEQVASASS